MTKAAHWRRYSKPSEAQRVRLTVRAQHTSRCTDSWWAAYATGDRRDSDYLATAYQRFPDSVPKNMPDLITSPSGVLPG